MADFDSSLPIRTETAGDVIIKVADATVPAQQLAVESDGSINVNASVVIPPGEKIIITDGTDDLAVNADGSINVVATATDLDIRDLTSATDSVEVLQATHDNLNLNANMQVGDADVANGNPVPVSDAGGSLTVDATDLDIRDLVFATDKVDASGTTLGANSGVDIGDVTINNGAGVAAVNVQDGGNSLTVDATDLDIRDLTHSSDSVKVGDGTDFLAVNTDGSINVRLSDRSGTEVDSYNTAAAVAAGGTSNHDYTTTGAFRLTSVGAAASGKMKIEVQVETAAASNVFNTKRVMFNSAASPNMDWELSSPILVASGARVRVIRTNNDNQAQDLYSTILGYNE